MLNLSYLETFLAVAEKKSFTKAAQSLYLTQTAVSFHIQTLEKYYSAKLFNRFHHDISLTKAGRLLQQYAQQILEIEREAKKTVTSQRDGVCGRLVAAASPTTGSYIISPLLNLFRNRFPETNLHLVVQNVPRINQLLSDGAVDIALIEPCVSNKGLKYYPVHKEQLVLISSPDNFLAGKTAPVEIREILEIPFLIREKECCTRVSIKKALNSVGLSLKDLNIVMIIRDLEGLKTAVRHSAGVTIISEWAVAREVSQGALKALRIKGLPLTRDRVVAVNKRENLSPAGQALLNFLLSEEVKDFLKSPKAFFSSLSNSNRRNPKQLENSRTIRRQEEKRR